MMRFLIIGVWALIVALGSSYASAYWAAGAAHGDGKPPALAGLEYRKLPTLTVPMIIDGTVKGYVLAKLVFTADSGVLRTLTVDPTVFVVDASFAEIYINGRVESGRLTKYNLQDMLGRIKAAANTRLNGSVVRDVLVDSLNYIDKADMRANGGSNAPAESEKPAKPNSHAKEG